jgi:putative peptidoglycan lipid II flippase
VNDARFRKLVTLAGPALLSMGISEINHMIDHALASGLNSGDISAMSYAYRLITFLLGVLMVPLTTIMFSKLSQQAAKDDTSGIAKMVMNCIEVVSMVILPITAICAVMSGDVIRAAYMRGQFDAQSVIVTAGPFLFYVIGLIGFGVRDMLNRAFHAVQDTKTPMSNSIITVGLNIVLNFILVRSMGANGLALATTLSGLIGAVMMFFRLRKRLGKLGSRDSAVEMLKILICTAFCMLTCLMLNHILPAATSSWTAFIRLAVVAMLSMIVYGGALLAAKVKSIHSAIDMVKRKLKRS